MKMIFIPTTGNTKTGDIMQSYSPRSACPKSCPLKGSGCYAESLRTSKIWSRADNKDDKRFVSSCEELVVALLGGIIEHIKEKESELIFRHNVAGDMAIEGTSRFDYQALLEIANAIIRVNAVYARPFGKSVKGYTYTHCELTSVDKGIIDSLRPFMTVNVSTDSIPEALKAKEEGYNVVLTSINPLEDIKALKEHNHNAIQCPAQTHESITCKDCRLCARERDAVVIFGIHGSHRAMARKTIQLHRNKLK